MYLLLVVGLVITGTKYAVLVALGIAVLVLGLAYAWRKGALKWQ